MANVNNSIVTHSTPQERLDFLVDEMIRTITEFAELALTSRAPTLYHIKRDTKEAKKFVVRQPAETKEWRDKMKGLLREYLDLKFSDNELKREMNQQDSPAIKVLRFMPFRNGCWYELPSERPLFSSLCRIEGDEKRVANLSLKESLLFQKGVLWRIFNGASVEEVRIDTNEIIPNAFWSGWKTWIGKYAEEISFLPQFLQNGIYSLAERTLPPNYEWIEYEQLIHPAMTEAAVEMLSTTQECHTIVEICGGTGELALSIAKKYGKPLNYHLLEINDRSRTLAKERLRGLPGHFVAIKTDVTNSADYFVDQEKKEKMPPCSVDLILGSGAIACVILESQEVAKNVTKKCFELLKPGGKMILSGHSFSLLSSLNYSEIGFKVLNRTLFGPALLPYSTDIGSRFLSNSFHNQFYILEKP